MAKWINSSRWVGDVPSTSPEESNILDRTPKSVDDILEQRAIAALEEFRLKLSQDSDLNTLLQKLLEKKNEKSAKEYIEYIWDTKENYWPINPENMNIQSYFEAMYVIESHYNGLILSMWGKPNIQVMFINSIIDFLLNVPIVTALDMYDKLIDAPDLSEEIKAIFREKKEHYEEDRNQAEKQRHEMMMKELGKVSGSIFTSMSKRISKK